MQVVKETGLDIYQVRQLLDNIILFNGSRCLSSISLVSHKDGKPMYDVEYVSKTQTIKVFDNV